MAEIYRDIMTSKHGLNLIGIVMLEMSLPTSLVFGVASSRTILISLSAIGDSDVVAAGDIAGARRRCRRILNHVKCSKYMPSPYLAAAACH